MIGAAAGAGALIGAGVDAMLERSPSAGLTQRGARSGVACARGFRKPGRDAEPAITRRRPARPAHQPIVGWTVYAASESDYHA